MGTNGEKYGFMTVKDSVAAMSPSELWFAPRHKYIWFDKRSECAGDAPLL